MDWEIGGDTTYTKIFVGSLAWETQCDTMRRYFEQFGDILEVVIITDKNTGRSNGYGFVTFKDPDSAMRACQDPSPVIDGRRANCNLASLVATNRTRPLLLNTGWVDSGLCPGRRWSLLTAGLQLRPCRLRTTISLLIMLSLISFTGTPLLLPEPFSFIFTWFAALPLIFWLSQAFTNAIVKDFLILKGPCPNCGTENVSFFGTILTIPSGGSQNSMKCSKCLQGHAWYLCNPLKKILLLVKEYAYEV